MFQQVVAILFPVFALMVTGYVIGVTVKPDFKPMNRLNMSFFTPALVFSSLSSMSLSAEQFPLLWASLIAVLLPGLLMLPISRFTGLNFKTWAPPHMFRNGGNLAIPLFTYAFGESALAPAVLLFVISVCLHVSVGLALINNSNPFKQMIRAPIFLAAAFAMLLNLSGVGVWVPLYESAKLLGQAAVPIMLLALGSQMRHLRIGGLKVGIICTVQSIVTGAFAFGVIYLFIPLTARELQMMVLFTMLPPAVMNYLFAEIYQVEPNNVASMVLFGNFFSLITLPVLLTVSLSLG